MPDSKGNLFGEYLAEIQKNLALSLARSPAGSCGKLFARFPVGENNGDARLENFGNKKLRKKNNRTSRLS